MPADRRPAVSSGSPALHSLRSQEAASNGKRAGELRASALAHARLLPPADPARLLLPSAGVWWNVADRRHLGNFTRLGRVDWARTVQMARRRGGILTQVVWKAMRTREAPWVVLCDVSGSMMRHWPFYQSFFSALGQRNGLALFTFGTHAGRWIFSGKRGGQDDLFPHSDYGQGTLIGAVLHEWQQQWGAQWISPRTVVWIISDGWDGGDPLQAGREMARLRAQVRDIVWINPWMATPGFRPATRTLKAVARSVRFRRGASVLQLLDVMRSY